ncbi:carboxypeptidase regulatory-like domain-containing protein [Actinacidiphila sp. bgisy144]|uniref:carboxypeptidase regulatory-like domain-containing protein n=1 Tax=Actinacidiphila sp. bgisy144 TaxID=3413791 RepID=UPI003EB8A235
MAKHKRKIVPDPTGKVANHASSRACALPKRAGQMACAARIRDDVKTTPAQLASADAAPAGLAPSDLRAAYSLDSASSGGRTVAIVDAYDDPSAEEDLAAYRSEYGLPACTTANGCFTKIDQRGGTTYPTPDSNWSVEIALDLDMVSAVCPDCHIMLVEADSSYTSDLGVAVNQAVAQGAMYVSNSWGGNEDPSQLSADTAYFDHPGVAITVSSGDYGYAYGTVWPASSPYVTAVGGTTLVKDASSSRGWTESAWSGAGSGCSGYEPKPAVQTNSGCTARTVADVSAVADPNTGVAVYEDGTWHVVGGTSAASPIIASVYALAGTPVGGSRPMSYPYALPSALHDVTAGNNGSCTTSYICTAGTGYDGPTGLGTPNGTAAFKGAPHGTVHGTMTDSATGKPIEGASVTIGSLSATAGPDGTYSLPVPVGNYQVSAVKFGYTGASRAVSVGDGASVTADLALNAKALVKVTGTVKDGSGHGWPLYATVRVAEEATSAVHTDPLTGKFTLEVPVDGTYTVLADPAYPGYTESTTSVTVGDTSVHKDFAPLADATTCSAPGYKTATADPATCAVIPGGLLTGQVIDKNTGQGVAGATITATDTSGASAVSVSTPDDPAVGDGFYALFHAAGTAQYRVSASNYTASSLQATVTDDTVSQQSITLSAPRLSVSKTSVNPEVSWLGKGSTNVTFTNSGSASVTLSLAEQPGSSAPLVKTAQAPLIQTKADTNRGPLTMTTPHAAAASEPSGAAGATWTPVPNLPNTVADNAGAAGDGVVYSVGGFSYDTGGVLNKVYAYDTKAGTWSTLPDMSRFRESAQAAYLYGKLYVFGGWSTGNNTNSVEIYDPKAKTWTAGANMPDAVARAGTAVVDGKVYIIGGCGYDYCTENTVQVYDPLDDTWSTTTPYPLTGGWYSCGAITGKIYCAGGTVEVGGGNQKDIASGYSFDPATQEWSPIADLPETSSTSTTTVANGELLLSGGVWDNTTRSNKGYAYDPTTNTWSTLPNANENVIRAAGACGFYRLGGSETFYQLVNTAELLPGYDQCGTDAGVDWLSESTGQATLAPGHSITVKLSYDLSGVAASQPGIWHARLNVTDNTPYPAQPVDIHVTMKAPSNWGKVSGTVSAQPCGSTAKAIPGALVGIQGSRAEYTLAVDQAGHYQLWLDVANNPLLVSAAKDGWGPRAAVVKLKKGKTTTQDFTLAPADGC